MPDKVGWYKIKTQYGIGEAPVSRTLGGKLVWVVPGAELITHWAEENAKHEPEDDPRKELDDENGSIASRIISG